MKKIYGSLALLVSLSFGLIHAQTNSSSAKSDSSTKIGVKIYGFVRNDVIFDSRQMASANDGELSLFPQPVSKNASGQDVNAIPTLNMASILTRAGFNITGPDAFGAKTTAIIEGEFWGFTGGATNFFNLRHAYAMLDWSKTQLAFGQYWHPMFNPDCYPGVVNFNTGIPFQPLNRSPQIRLTQKLDKDNHLSLILAAISQLDMPSPGPGGGSNTYLAQGVTPNLHAQLMFKVSTFMLGAGVDYLSIRPELSSAGSISTNRVNSVRFLAYTKILLDPIQIKAQVTSGGNLNDQVMLGGYLGYNSASATIQQTYQDTKTTGFWLDINTTGKKVVPGLFFGYTANSGSSQTGADAAYGMGIGTSGAAIKSLSRISPRVEFVSGKFKFGTELEFTTASYGTAASDGTVSNTTSVTNTRFIFMSKFSF